MPFLLLEPDLDDLEGSDDTERLGHSGKHSGEHPPAVAQVAVLVAQRRGIERVGAHAQGVLEGQVGREGGEPFPEGRDALLLDDGGAAVVDAC